ncbi:baseplate J/gp47 family protein [Burkholderia multivorans]|uniref:baseplate J/gp47 family protein n=1 Tax=Burkholderia multivorans TaxID=87883 RepID=UPI0021D879DA|nr:baseplate J/gp47 family protein [Burkholderia multivorans]UXZ62694.1 baseplate J/gp47 family protein [Burkholderia multivorans]
MPYSRPTLTDLKKQIWTDITTSLGLVVSLLQRAVVRILGSALAGLVYGLYGYLDWIARQAVPWTAVDEHLAAWGALKGVYLKAAQPTTMRVQFQGAPNTPIPADIGVSRQADGFAYTVTVGATSNSSGIAVVTVAAVTAGSAGNCDNGTAMVLSSAVAGIQSNGMVVETIQQGTDVESQSEFQGRVMQAFQNPAHGGDQQDYVEWAEAIAGVTRAWCMPNGFGAGTVVLYFMMDDAESQHGGFPQGTDGVSQYDEGPDGLPRGVVATGDQLMVADAIVTQQPVTALVYACSPIKNALGFTISGIADPNAQASVVDELSGVLFRNGKPRGTIEWSDLTGAINAVPGTSGYLITGVSSTVNGVTVALPTNANITMSAGQLPALGVVTFV